MTEPPAKRPRRTDSSTMWDINDRWTRTRSSEPELDERASRREPHAKGDGRRHRSRSRDWREKRHERSRSRERKDMYEERERIRDRSRSRTRRQERRDYPRKSERYRERTRSRSPMRRSATDRSRTPLLRDARSERQADRRGPRLQVNGTVEPQTSSQAKDDTDMDVDARDGDGDLECVMRKSMGFTRFRSTKNTKVPGNNIYGVRKEKKIQYRQYMNRTGGFNRPLSP